MMSSLSEVQLNLLKIALKNTSEKLKNVGFHWTLVPMTHLQDMEAHRAEHWELRLHLAPAHLDAINGDMKPRITAADLAAAVEGWTQQTVQTEPSTLHNDGQLLRIVVNSLDKAVEVSKVLKPFFNINVQNLHTIASYAALESERAGRETPHTGMNPATRIVLGNDGKDPPHPGEVRT